MELSYAEGRTCSVCGSRITDNNPDGIGVECRYAFKKAKASVYFDDKKRAYGFYGVRASLVMPLFIAEHKDIKFRSSFKKSFYPSVVEQWETKNFLSKKQLEICENWLYPKMHHTEVEELNNKIGKIQQCLIENWKPTDEEQQKIFNYANKFRHEFRRQK